MVKVAVYAPKQFLVRLTAIAAAQQAEQHGRRAALGKRGAAVLGDLRGDLEELESLQNLRHLLAVLQRRQRRHGALAQAQRRVCPGLELSSADASTSGGYILTVLHSHTYRAIQCLKSAENTAT